MQHAFQRVDQIPQPEWSVYASPVLETLHSMESLLNARYSAAWADEARQTLGSDYMAELAELLGPFRNGTDIFEVAVAKGYHEDVPAFVDYVRASDVEEFIYYIFGQIVPRGKDVSDLKPSELRSLFENYGEYAHYLENVTWFSETAGKSARSAEELKHRFAALVEQFWNDYFSDVIDALRLRWNLSVAKNEAYGEENGVSKLYTLLTEQTRLPSMVPREEPLRRIDFVPIVNMHTASRKYIGEGVITCLFKADRTEERIAELHAAERDSIRLAKALGDKTRMNIVKLIFQYEEVLNGQNIAEMTGLAKSVVSKHLRQLIDAGLIVERTRDNRNNLYSVNTDAIQRISGQLLEVLRG